MFALKSIAVFCGSSPGESPVYADAARQLAESLVRRDLGLIYGGASKGIMGVVADRVLQLGGTAIGIIPKSLQEKEIAHDGLTELHVVDTMHDRKLLISQMSGAFIALPGGAGTLEEIIEAYTWAQLEIHNKPCGLLNTAGYYDQLIKWFDHATTEGFLRPGHRSMLQVESDADQLIERFYDYEAPVVRKWVD